MGRDPDRACVASFERFQFDFGHSHRQPVRSLTRDSDGAAHRWRTSGRAFHPARTNIRYGSDGLIG